MLLPRKCRGYRRWHITVAALCWRLEGGDLHQLLEKISRPAPKNLKTPQVHECCNRFWLCFTTRTYNIYVYILLYERPPKPPTIRNSFTRTLVLDTIMKLSGTIGVTQKTMTLIHMFASFWVWRLSSSKLISARNEASKNIQKLRAKKRDIISCTKWTHLKNWKVKGNSERWPNDDHFLSFWVLIDTSPQRAHNGFLAGKKLFYSFSLLLLLLFLLLLLVLLLLLLFVSITCSFHVHEHQTLRNDRGHTKNDDHFSHVLSRM